MKTSVKLSAFFMALLGALSCAASRSTPQEPWRIDVVTTGGFAGRGAGNYAVDHEGNVVATLFNGNSCTFRLTEDELRHIRELLANARPREWKESYVPENPCCDRIEYTLTVNEAGTQSKTTWIDDPLPRPADLVALAEAIIGGEAGSIRMLATNRCER